MHGDVGAPDAGPVRGEGLAVVAADPDQGDVAGLPGADRVAHAVEPVVGAVVVGDGHQVDARAPEHVERFRPGAEPVAVRRSLELLVGPVGAGRDGRLQVHHGQVGLAQDVRHRAERGLGVPGHVAVGALEVHVAGEGQAHRALGGGRLGGAPVELVEGRGRPRGHLGQQGAGHERRHEDAPEGGEALTSARHPTMIERDTKCCRVSARTVAGPGCRASPPPRRVTRCRPWPRCR